MPQVIVNKQLVSYNRAGSGKPVLLLHGWGDSAAGLQNVIDNLAKKYDVIALDLPGFGASEDPKNQPWGVDTYAKFVGSFLDKLNITNLYAIIGHSNGGSIAIWGIANSAFNANKLVLLAAAGIRNQSKKPLHKKLAFNTAKTISKLLPTQLQSNIRKNVYQKSGSDIFVAPHLEPSFRLLVSQDMREFSKLINIPTLLIYGQNDTATPVAYGEIYNKNITNSRLVVVENAGHFVHIDAEHTTLKAINNFLGDNE